MRNKRNEVLATTIKHELEYLGNIIRIKYRHGKVNCTKRGDRHKVLVSKLKKIVQYDYDWSVPHSR